MLSTPKQRATLLAVIFATVILISGGVYLTKHKSTLLSFVSNGSVCTKEIRTCSDGSRVSRSGPSCAFAACSTIYTSGWKTYTSKNVAYKYPESLQTTYITPQFWPPEVTTAPGVFSCKETRGQITSTGQTTKKVLEGSVFCVTVLNEGAAGSTYTTYVYTTSQGNNMVKVKIVLRAPQCANYDDPEKTECQEERTIFDIDTIAARVAHSVQVP